MTISPRPKAAMADSTLENWLVTLTSVASTLIFGVHYRRAGGVSLPVGPLFCVAHWYLSSVGSIVPPRGLRLPLAWERARLLKTQGFRGPAPLWYDYRRLPQGINH